MTRLRSCSNLQIKAMTELEAKQKDKILGYLKKSGSGTYIKENELAEKLGMSSASVIHNCREMEADEFIQSAHSKDGWSFLILDSGLHHLDQGGFEISFEAEQRDQAEYAAYQNEERSTWRVQRKGVRWSIALSILAVIIAGLSFLAQILGWFS